MVTLAIILGSTLIVGAAGLLVDEALQHARSHKVQSLQMWNHAHRYHIGPFLFGKGLYQKDLKR